MTQIRLHIDSKFMSDLKERLGLTSDAQVVSLALGLMRWMAQEAHDQRVILSATPDGTDLRRLISPSLTAAQVGGLQ